MDRRMSEACRLADLKRQKVAFAANFVGIHGRRRFEEEFANRSVKVGRLVDLDFLHKIEFPYLKTIKEFRWITYLTSRIEVFDGLVKIFYTNAMKVSDECFSTYIMGRYYEIKRGTIAVALGIADEREEYNAYKDHKTLSFAKKVLEKRNLRVASRYAKVLKMHDRLLHLIITYILTPSGTSYSVIQRHFLRSGYNASEHDGEPEMDFEEMESGDEDGMNVESAQSSITELAATIDDVKGRVYNVEKQMKKILDLLTAMHG
ncbi:hypothetical protein PTKIN_Ptkin11bG0090600 [Pterospermum kingtungense]